MSPVFHPVFSRSPPRRPVLPASTVFAALLMASVGPVHAQIYVSEPIGNADAPVVLSNFSSDETPRLIVANPTAASPTSQPAGYPAGEQNASAATAQRPLSSTAMVGRIHEAPRVPAHLLPIFASAAREHSLPASLLMAVAAAESGFNAHAVSPKGALGLMQLMPDTARQHGVRQVWSVLDNVRGGAAHLRQLLNRFSGQQALALAAYNAGERAVLNAGLQIPPFDETQRYVPKVLAWRSQYEKVTEPSPTGVPRQHRTSAPNPERPLVSVQVATRTMRLP